MNISSIFVGNISGLLKTIENCINLLTYLNIMITMKKLNQIFLLLILGLTMSCSSDDDSNSNSEAINAELIIGTWTWSSQSVNGVDLGELSECELLETYIFDETQVEQIDYFGDPCEEAFRSTENYSIDGNTIRFSDVDDATDFYEEEITVLNATTLKIKYEEEYEGETFTNIDTYTRVE